MRCGKKIESGKQESRRRLRRRLASVVGGIVDPVSV
jgi:hypothetical protein